MSQPTLSIAVAGVAASLSRAMASLPRLLGARAVSLFKANFREEGFFGSKWPDVLRRTGGTRQRGGKAVRVKPARGARGRRKILTETGNLGRSIDYEVEAGGRAVVVRSTATAGGAPYGRFHNDGARGLPRRRFIGEHPALSDALADAARKALGRVRP